MKLSLSSVLMVALAVSVAGAVPTLHADVIANWTFETSVPTTAGPFVAEAGVNAAVSQATGFHASASAVYSNPVGNGSPESFSSNFWAVGDYYQFSTSTIGYDSLIITWDQTSSTTGPRDFVLSYSTDGTAFTAIGSPYTVLANSAPIAWTGGTSFPEHTHTQDLSGITALNNQATVYFRMVDNSTSAANNTGTVATTGTDRIDNVVIGTIPEPASLGLLALGAVGLLARRKK